MTRRASGCVVVCTLAALACDGAKGESRPPDPCVMKYPRGMNQVVASNDSITQAVTECRGDDGACKAMTACKGSPADRQCDMAALITAQAAACVAEANGLAPGITNPRTNLVYDFVYRRITWNVSNTMYDGARGERPEAGGGVRGGQSATVDAIDARLLNRFDWSADQ